MEAAGGVKIMGVVNVAADSFSDGGKFLDVDAAVVGTTAPLPEIIDDLRRGGVAAISPTGVLGDPTTADAEHGAEVMASLVDGLAGALSRWEPSATGRVR